MSSLEALAVSSVLSLLSDAPAINKQRLDINNLQNAQIVLIVRHASHILQLGQLEAHFLHSTGQKLESIVPALQKYYCLLLPPSVRATIQDNQENTRSIAFQFHIQYSIQNEHVPDIFKYTLHEYIDKLCFFGQEYIETLQLRTNLFSFFTRHPGILMQSIQYLKSLRVVDFSSCSGTLAMVHTIISLLKVSSSIEELYLQGNKLTQHEMIILSNAIQGSPSRDSLRVLNVNWNQIGDEGLIAVALIIRNCRNIHTVSASHCGGEINGRELCKKAAKDKKLKNLVLL